MSVSRTFRRALVPATAVVAALAAAAALLLTGGTDPEVDTAASRSAGSGGGADVLETIPLPLGLQPEGITSDGESTFFVGSLADGRVVRGDLASGDTDVLVPGRPGRVAVGMQLERRHDRLWVAGGPTGAVTVYDADSGDELGRWVTPGSVFLNDVTVTRDAAYVTDSGRQHLVVVPLASEGGLPPADGADTLELTGDFTVVPDKFNANGIRSLAGGNRLVLVQGNTATLFVVDPETGSTDAVEVTEGELAGGDGLELARGRLFVVRGGGDNTVAAVKLGQGGRSAEVDRVLSDPDFDVPTTATFADGRLWVVNARFGTEPTPTTEYDVVRVDLD